MATTHITTTRRGEFNALRHQGILVTDSWAQLGSMLANSLSQKHALLLAEPVHEASGSATDWYTEAQGDVRPLSALPESEQRLARQAFSTLAADIEKLALELKNDPGATKNIRGNILSLALRYPSENNLYMVGSQPVVTNWGFEPGTAGAQPEDLVRLGAAMPAAAVSAALPRTEALPPPAPVSGFAWWRAVLSFLLGLLLLVALFYLAGMLLGPAGCAVPAASIGGCATPPAPVTPGGCAPAVVGTEPADPEVNKELVAGMTAEQERERSLRAELEDLRRRLAERAALCVPPKKEEPAPPAKEPEPPVAQEPPVEEEIPSLADLMPTSPEPPVVEPEEQPQKEQPQKQRPQKEQPQKQRRGEDMKIPESARRNNDTSFLEGCWNSETGLVSTSGEPVTVQYCFDGNGNGSRSVTRQKSGDRCTGSVRARFDSAGRLHFDADGAPCPKGGGFVPHKVECTPGSDGKATCKGQEQGRRNKWDARFRRS